jgi:hypothetical protein
MDQNPGALFIESVDIGCYKAADRKIRRVFPRANPVLVAMVINFAHFRDLAVPIGHRGKGWREREQALAALLDGGYAVLLQDYWHDMEGGAGRCRTYRRTALFDKVFRFRLKWLRPLVPDHILSEPLEPEPPTHNETKMNLIPALSTYVKLVEGTVLALADGSQVYTRVVLVRKSGKRLYARGIYNYQSGIHKEERTRLVINGEGVVELDYSAMHGNMLLNREGEPSRADFYERILKELGEEPKKENRDAVKVMTNAAFNVAEDNGYAGAVGNERRGPGGKRLVEILGSRPKQVREAIVRAYPKLAPYVCAGKHWEWLQETDSEIMIDVLETLAGKGIIGLPVHDSVLAPAKHADKVKIVMSICYRRRMGRAPVIKAKWAAPSD